jgi:hypothetical protein
MGSGWPFRSGYICGLSAAYRGDGGIHAHYFPLRHPDSANFDPAQAYQWLRDLIASGVRFVTQNGLYDWGWVCTEAGIKMPVAEQLEEIGALATIVDENRHGYGLDALCAWRGLPGKDIALLKEAAIALGMPKRAKPRNATLPSPNCPHATGHRGPARQRRRRPECHAGALFESLEPILDREGTRDAKYSCRRCSQR